MLLTTRRIAVACLLPLSALAAEPVKHIGVYVQPYYEAAQSREGRPRVAVGEKFNELLASGRQKDVVAARDLVQAQPQNVTPMTLMVLAIRLYDAGLRDDSAFWFYVAKDRYFTLAEVVEVRSPALAQVEQATRDFATLAGPTINGYAFCSIANQKTLRMQALEWVEKNPYQALFMAQLPEKPGGRAANLEKALAKLRARARDESAYLDKPETLAMLARGRKENDAERKYCWK